MDNNTEEIQRLEEILRANPDSPVFAQLATLYIDNGEYLHALALCDRGTGIYPEYATGFLLRATALKHLDKPEEAIENYRKVLEILPRCSVAGKEIESLTQKVEEPKPDISPGKTAEESGKDTDEIKEQETGSIEDLAERLKGYKPERPARDIKSAEPFEIDEHEGNDLPIVSETLANIFSKQKQYDRAIEAYRQLIKRNPQKADIYFTRIKELEEAKKNEQ